MALKSIDSIVSNIVSKVSIVSKRGGWLDMALSAAWIAEKQLGI